MGPIMVADQSLFFSSMENFGKLKGQISKRQQPYPHPNLKVLQAFE